MSKSYIIGTLDIPQMGPKDGNDGTNGRDCEFGGWIGSHINMFHKFVKKHTGANCTIYLGTEYGSLNETSGKYSGLVGDLQTGKIDGMAVPVYYPLRDDDDFFRYSPPVYEDTMTIVSMYNKTTTAKDSDVLNMFDPIPLEMWFTLFVAFVVQAAVMRLGHKLLCQNGFSYALWDTFCVYMDQDDFPIKCKHIAILISSASIALFFQVTMLKNLVKTDLVVYDKPITIASYDDIISRNISFGLNKLIPEKDKFEGSPIGSKERIIADTLQEDFSFTNFQSALKRAPRQELVIGGRKILSEAISLFVMNHYKDRKNARALISKEKYPKKYTNVFSWTTKSPSYVLTYGSISIKRLFESGVLDYGFDEVPWRMNQFLNPEILRSTWNRVSEKVEEEKPDFMSIAMKNVHRLFYCFCAMVVISVYALIFEIMWFLFFPYEKWEQIKEKRRQQMIKNKWKVVTLKT